MGKKYVILGGGGSFGLNCAKYLLSQIVAGEVDRVIGVGRAELRPSAFTLGLENSARFSYHAFHIWHERDELMKMLDEEKPDVIVNFAAQGEGAASWNSCWRFYETNAVALAWLHETLISRAWYNDRGTKFIHIGTSELYGSVTKPAKETDPIVPSSPYAASKAAFDLHLLALDKMGQDHSSTILRPSNAYCEGQLLHRIIPRAIVCGLTGSTLPLHGGGIAEKSYIHVDDLSRAIHMVAEKDQLALRTVYNVGPEEPIAILQLAKRCAAAVGLEFGDLFIISAERLGQDAKYWLDSSAIKEDLGWEPGVELDEGLGRVRNWAAANLDTLREWHQDYTLRA